MNFGLKTAGVNNFLCALTTERCLTNSVFHKIYRRTSLNFHCNDALSSETEFIDTFVTGFFIFFEGTDLLSLLQRSAQLSGTMRLHSVANTHN